MEWEMSADEEGALVVGSGKWSGVGWAWGSTSKEPSKHASERMAAAGALVAEGKTAEKNEGVHRLAVGAGRGRESVGVKGWWEGFGRWARPSIFMEDSWEVGCWVQYTLVVLVVGREAGDVWNER